ncbi:hypothetical protein E2C01_038682 [Portunus trituberculatus]|uniref:Uncharacterized protein n=1 Tax=Portunus trituberculatus TaxID=210409 RepID=A0A5B7FIL5_PORTR|nr:hypothetical protein [Portunus trituberculatus]
MDEQEEEEEEEEERELRDSGVDKTSVINTSHRTQETWRHHRAPDSSAWRGVRSRATGVRKTKSEQVKSREATAT